MVVPDWLLPILGLLVPLIVSFWGWLAVKVIDQGRKLVELESRINSQEKTCIERLDWIRRIENKVDDLPEKIVDQLVMLGVIGREGEKDEDD